MKYWKIKLGECSKSKNTGIEEKAAFWLVTKAMKVKCKMGAGCGFTQMVTAAKNSIKHKMKENNTSILIRTCLTAAQKSKTKKTKTLRIIPIPKNGGVLPLISIFAGLSTLGATTGGIGNKVKVVNDLKSDKNTSVYLGEGLYLTPYQGIS